MPIFSRMFQVAPSSPAARKRTRRARRRRRGSSLGSPRCPAQRARALVAPAARSVSRLLCSPSRCTGAADVSIAMFDMLVSTYGQVLGGQDIRHSDRGESKASLRARGFRCGGRQLGPATLHNLTGVGLAPGIYFRLLRSRNVGKQSPRGWALWTRLRSRGGHDCVLISRGALPLKENRIPPIPEAGYSSR